MRSLKTISLMTIVGGLMIIGFVVATDGVTQLTNYLTLFFLDREGRIRKKHVGFMDQAALKEEIHRLF